VAKQDLPGLGERDRPRPARTLDQPQADDALEGRDLLRDGGLGVAEALGRPAERAFVGDRLERHQVPEIETVPAIRLHDRTLSDQQCR
jgi:hypothetical protein